MNPENPYRFRDIAKKAGVSDTGRLARLQGQFPPQREDRARILTISRELNYFPNRPARALRSGDSVAIRIHVTDITDPFYSR